MFDTEPTVESVDVDLDTFSTEFFGRSEVEPEASTSDVVEEDEQSSDAQKENSTIEDDDTLATEDEAEEGEPVDETDAAKPKKNRFQERVDELVGRQRETERKLQAALDELAQTKSTKEKDPEPAPKARVPDTADLPNPLDKNDDGTDKYPLGEFDPTYIRDVTLHTFRQERAAEEQAKVQQAEAAKIEAERQELTTNWNEKLGPAKERYPDFDEKGQQLDATFATIDQGYGEYLASTLMSMDYGPDVLYYLANNLDEAAKIVNSGPTKAVIALGRLEAKFADFAEEKQKARPRVSSAPPPPGQVNKGTSVAKATVRGDEDDLEAFSRALFKKR